MTNRETTVYSLNHPITGEIRYIGKTVQSLRQRLNEHISEAGNYKAQCWIKSMIRKQLKPIIKPIAVFNTHEEGLEAEKMYIEFFRVYGCNLTNLSEGGYGSLGWKMPLEIRNKISKALIGNAYGLGSVRSEEVKKQTSLSMKNKYLDEDYKNNWLQNRPRGTDNKKSKITENDAREIRRRCALGETQRSVSLDYPINDRMVSMIVNGKFWKEAI